jgi:membrane peptidoglycan carboxypeptidase
VGYTPDLSAAVWVGYSEGLVPMTNVHGVTVYGGTFPAQIWRKFAEKALADVPPTDFQEAEFYYGDEESEWVTVEVCTESGLLATPYCPHTESRTFRREDRPTRYCPIHTPQASQVSVPSVVGMGEAEARQVVAGAGLTASVSYQYSSSAASGTVISQSPLGGSTVDSGSTVYLVVSKGAPPASVVPNVVGLGEAEAKAVLANAGFTCKVVPAPADDPSKVGIVISQFPGGGATASPGAQVIITVGR